MGRQLYGGPESGSELLPKDTPSPGIFLKFFQTKSLDGDIRSKLLIPSDAFRKFFIRKRMSAGALTSGTTDHRINLWCEDESLSRLCAKRAKCRAVAAENGGTTPDLAPLNFFSMGPVNLCIPNRALLRIRE
jgi:hypothetical protein